MSEAAKTRYEIGADIIVAMVGNEEFPFGNIHRLAASMQEYFESEGHIDTLISLGYRWRPTVDYWIRHLADVREYLRKSRKLYLEYFRTNDGDGFTGEWRLLRKREYESVMSTEKRGIETRLETFNGRLEDGNDRWSLQTTYIESNDTLLVPGKN